MPYLKIPDVARRLDISEKTARRYVKAGLIPSAFIGGAYRISEEALDKYVRNAQVGAGADSPKKAQAPLPLEDAQRRGAPEQFVGSEPLYNAYEGLGHVLASGWKDDLKEWEEKIPEGELPNSFNFGGLVQWAIEIAGMKALYSAIARDSGQPLRAELEDTLKLMEEADREAFGKVRRVLEPAKTYVEFRKIWEASGMEALINQAESR